MAGWEVDADGALWRTEPGGGRRGVTSTAPWVACDLVDVDTGDVRALVRMRVPGRGVVERAMDREALLSQSKVIGSLVPMGANVSSSNCREVIRYLTDCERRLGAGRPRRRSSRHMGWADAPLGAFLPFDAGEGAEVRFDPAPDGLAKARPFMEPAGTLAGWVAGVSPARDASPAFRCVLAASFASPLVAVAGVQPFIVYLWGDSRSGKTPTLKAAGSVWGDPTEDGAYFRSFSDTPKSLARAAALLHDVPLIVDDLQSKGAPGGQQGKRQAVEDLLYSLSIGHERGALNADRSMMRGGGWRCLTLATGEIPIVGEATQRGAANRTLELNGEPFSDTAAARAMHHLVAREHGTAGRAYVGALRGNGAAFYRDALADMSGRVQAIPGAAAHPQADNVALLALADALAGFYVFGDGAWDACAEGALGMARWALAHSAGADAGDTDLKAIQFLSEWLERSAAHFGPSCDDRIEPWGELDEGPDGRCTWYVLPRELARALGSEGFDERKTLRRMRAEGLLLVGRGRNNTRQRRFRSGRRQWCYCVDGGALEAYLTRAALGASPMAPGGDATGDGAGDAR